MKKITILVITGMIFVVPMITSAASYHYINLKGNVVTVEANNAAEAMAIANARSDVLHSGVKVDQGFLESGDVHGIIYQYVDVLGNVRIVVAASVDAAFLLANDRASNSGVLNLGPVQR